MKSILFFSLFSLISGAVSATPTSVGSRVPTVEECEANDENTACCFIDMPESLTHLMVIADSSEPGVRLTISGRVFKADTATPYAGVYIYAYHTDNTGYYPKRRNETGIQKSHGRLHGWCVTDENGAYQIRSIRPAPYPSGGIPADIHAVVRLPDQSTIYYISDFVFSGDSNVTEQYKRGPHGAGVVILREDETGRLYGERNITLR